MDKEFHEAQNYDAVKNIVLQENTPWLGLVKKSPVMSSVGHHATETSPLFILLVTKKIANADVLCSLTA